MEDICRIDRQAAKREYLCISGVLLHIRIQISDMARPLDQLLDIPIGNLILMQGFYLNL